MIHRRLGILIFACACLPGLSAVVVNAQAPEPAATRCDTLLTEAEVVQIVGKGFQGPNVTEPRPGFTACTWQAQGANFGFTFSSTRLLQTERRTADEAFEADVAGLENGQQKREILPDIGLKAARVSLGDDGYLVEVQRPDGVARMIFYRISDKQVIALARAMASP
jgi:hypothetical protein